MILAKSVTEQYNGKQVLTLIKQTSSRSSQKHLRMDLDTKLNFQKHLDDIMSKVDKSTGLLHNL